MKKQLLVLLLLLMFLSSCVSHKLIENKSLKEITKKYVDSLPMDQYNFMFGNDSIIVEYKK